MPRRLLLVYHSSAQGVVIQRRINVNDVDPTLIQRGVPGGCHQHPPTLIVYTFTHYYIIIISNMFCKTRHTSNGLLIIRKSIYFMTQPYIPDYACYMTWLVNRPTAIPCVDNQYSARYSSKITIYV